jgi:ABC transport system ATP-binding/permease protein
MDVFPDMAILLSANEIRLTYGYQTLLDGVTLAVSAREKTGMVGRNGCGKTSLLKIFTGQQMADSGEISLRRALQVGYLPQEFELESELSFGVDAHGLTKFDSFLIRDF